MALALDGFLHRTTLKYTATALSLSWPSRPFCMWRFLVFLSLSHKVILIVSIPDICVLPYFLSSHKYQLTRNTVYWAILSDQIVVGCPLGVPISYKNIGPILDSNCLSFCCYYWISFEVYWEESSRQHKCENHITSQLLYKNGLSGGIFIFTMLILIILVLLLCWSNIRNTTWMLNSLNPDVARYVGPELHINSAQVGDPHRSSHIVYTGI